MLKTILLVEDNEDDVVFMRRAIKHAAVTESVQVVTDGQDAVDYLAGIGKFEDRRQYPMPRIVLLDLKLPRKGGLEVLQWIRSQPRLSRIIVLVLSTSRERSDIVKAYELGANAFLVKPPAYQQLAEMVEAIKIFWLGFNEFVLPE
ncbi:MAG: response regulator with CheY-like receiver domain and winged-helix DNA-binding domain [Verrucomicrobiales bacterium]|nr:response regulator with CheY-like receiver domain and winged-helix DNA-binding domain [Verrucomicrobiales bacterium]